MMYSVRAILHIVFILGIISFGCKTKHTDRAVLRGEFNQVDRFGKKQGLWKIYEDSILIGQGTYTDGKPDGLWSYWYQNAQKKEEGHYIKGLKNGM